MKVGAVIVAAGLSSRMKQLKQLMKIGDLTLAEHVVSNFQRAHVDEIVMVLGHRADEIQKELAHTGVAFLKNDAFATTDMFTSACIGLKYMAGRADRILFCPVDVAMFTKETVTKLVETEGELLFPVHEGKIGHPILFSSELVPEILEYKGDRGLKGALDQLSAPKTMVEISDFGTLMDADTEEDFQKMKKYFEA